MKVVKTEPFLDPAVQVECSKGHQFYVDPCGEENLEWSDKYKSLKAVCPICGEREEDEHLNNIFKKS